MPGATWLRRGLQSSAGHTEDQSPRKYIWKSNSRKRRTLRSSRLNPARLCTGGPQRRVWQQTAEPLTRIALGRVALQSVKK